LGGQGCLGGDDGGVHAQRGHGGPRTALRSGFGD
jgi:hypothetical protein